MPPYEVEIKISSANDLKNVNWKHGDLKPYAVVWVDPISKFSTKVDENGDTSPIWNETLVLPLTISIQDSILSIDIVHAYAAKHTKSLIGSVCIPIQQIVDDVGIAQFSHRTFNLKRPSGRPHGRLEVKILVRYCAPDPYYAPPPSYGVPLSTSRNYQEPYPYSNPTPNPSRNYQEPYPYSNPTPNPYVSAPYTYNSPGYTEQTIGAPGYSGGVQQTIGAPGYNDGVQQQQKAKGSKFGIGTGLAVGAVAGVLGGLALAEGIDHVEDKIADDVEERIANDDYGEDY